MEDRGTTNDLSGSVTGNVVQARSIGQVQFTHVHREPEPVAPSQLPPAPGSFAGRDRELAALRGQWADRDGGPLVVVLTGPAGVGKTSLALRWLHELRDGGDVPDGQLFADLGAAGRPASPGEVLDGFAAALGVPASRRPAGPGLYRSVTASRRLAVLLDDAVSAEQVRPLVPASAGSVVVVTSRFRLSGLVMDGAGLVEVEPMDRDGSLRVLRRLLGPARVAGEDEAAAELASLCGGLPLALSLVGARLSTRPRRSLRREVAELRGEQRRLDALALDGVSVEAVFDAAYGSLEGDARRLYRMCAVHPGREFGVELCAAVFGTAGLDRLLGANLLAETGDGRFAMHALLRLHAARRGAAEDPAQDRTAALRRVAGWYLDGCVAADVVIHPLRARLGPRYAVVPARFGSEREAMAWLELERANVHATVLAAAGAGLHELVWQLCEALWGFFLHTRRYGEWIELHERAIDSARRCRNPLAEARMRAQLAFAYAKLRRFDEAAAQSHEVLRLATSTGDDPTRATALSQLGRAARGTGDLVAALGFFRESRDVHVRLRRAREAATCRRRIGDVLNRLGRYDEAVAELRAAASAMAELGDRTQHARTLTYLGTTELRAGHPSRASAALTAALSLVREHGSPYYQAEVLARLGEVAEANGEPASAREYYREAVELYTAAGDARAATLRSRLEALDR